jgi:hypothetical protein
VSVRKVPVIVRWSMIAAAAASVLLLGASPASASVSNGLPVATAGASVSKHATRIMNNTKEIGYAGLSASDASAASTTDGFQWATKGTPPSGLSGCTTGYEVEICFQKYGDKVWVRNTSLLYAEYGHYSNWLRDNNSNWVFWRNGDCGVDFNGWGYCNKDMYEDSSHNALGGYGSGIRLYPCDFEFGCTSYYTWVRNNA